MPMQWIDCEPTAPAAVALARVTAERDQALHVASLLRYDDMAPHAKEAAKLSALIEDMRFSQETTPHGDYSDVIELLERAAAKHAELFFDTDEK